MAFSSVCIDSATLASLLTDVAASRGDFDGLLFGCEAVRRSTRLNDDTDGASIAACARMRLLTRCRAQCRR